MNDYKLNQVLEELALLRSEIKDLRDEVKTFHTESTKASDTLVNHINFVNSVYAGMQRPLNYLMNKVNNIFLLGNE
jgi:FtsZ-binding cell division protein ZapB